MRLKTLPKGFLSLVLLYLVYEPAITQLLLGVHFYYVNIAVVSVLLALRLIETGSIKIEKRIVNFSLIIFACSIYTLLITALNQQEIRFFQHFYVIIEILSIYLLYTYIAKYYDDSGRVCLDVLKTVVVLEAIFVLLMFLLPAFKQFGVNLYYAENSAEINYYVVSKRIYGIFGDYTFKCQVFNGMLSFFFLFCSYLKKESGLLIYSVLSLFISVVNGRTGLLILIVITIEFLGLQLIMNKGQLTKVIKIAVLGIAGSVVVLLLVRKFNPDTYEFVINMFNAFLGLETNGDNNLVVLKESMSFPTGLGLILGEGVTIYTGVNRTDIGYCNDVYLVGVIVTAIEYISVIALLKVRSRLPEAKIYNICMTTGLLVTNIKGVCMRSGTIIVGLLWLRIIMENSILPELRMRAIGKDN
ncbi:hypothetical protein [Gemmiger sp. An50]|uniref:hypothetical protein n=1 Tax=Gemmiger sp. An50 TaxID=1965639 RepID=UPI000B36AFEB|nr:hypothetical protein [Gemmiger sp. An50]OUN88059.1 hypothetical protein B5G03_00310 [Gemmiger sp. An50]